jgi:hypothetical protein
MKTHLRILAADCRDVGQTEYEYSHLAACGYVRDNVTFTKSLVDCKLCQRSEHMRDPGAIKQYRR